MDELKQLVRELNERLDTQHGDNTEIRDDITSLQASNAKHERSNDRLRRWVVVLVVAVLIAAVFIWRFVAQSNCNTDRTKALSGPSNSRVTHLEGAVGAALTPPHLTPTQRDQVLAELEILHKRYGQIPTGQQLKAQTDAQLLVYLEFARSHDAQVAFDNEAKHHPVCSLF